MTFYWDSRPVGQIDVSSFTDRDIQRPIQDFNYPNKCTGYLAQDSIDFTFIGPDRQLVAITSIDQLIVVADIIRSTGLPNYRVARVPIESALKDPAWEFHLRNYSDKRVLQYIKFGFSLSLTNSSQLCNKEVNNHYSACQYLKEVQKYIDKEKSFGALLVLLIILHMHNTIVLF